MILAHFIKFTLLNLWAIANIKSIVEWYTHPVECFISIRKMIKIMSLELRLCLCVLCNVNQINKVREREKSYNSQWSDRSTKTNRDQQIYINIEKTCFFFCVWVWVMTRQFLLKRNMKHDVSQTPNLFGSEWWWWLDWTHETI